jgi:hypothetical protein
MKKCSFIFIWFVLTAVLLPACTGPRSIRPDLVNPELCRLPFYGTPRRYIHVLDAELPGGVCMTVIGVSVIDPESETLQAAIMTLEGLVLFDATASSSTLRVHRALPPFDGDLFAAGLMRDVRFIFMLPADPPKVTGIADDGASVCRYQDTLGNTLDVVVHPGNDWVIEQYSSFGKKLRSLRFDTLKNGIPSMLEFEAFSPTPYALHMRLLSVEPVSPDTIN